MTERISVVGLGRLGLPLATVLASQGFRVIGVDNNPAVLKSVRECRPKAREPGLAEMLRTRTRLSVTDDLPFAVSVTGATIVIVATPSGKDGCFSLRHVLPAVESVGRALQEKETYHLVIVSSTVNPGDCEGPIWEALEESSGKEIGAEIGLCHVPEFVALGKILEGYLDPDFVLIGSSDAGAARVAEAIYKRLCRNSPPFKHTNLVNAEIAKIAANCHTVLKTVFANQIAELCEVIRGADVDEVTESIGLDSRASPEYLTGSTFAGGPCFPRDMKTLPCVARRYGIVLPLFGVADMVNHWQVKRLAKMAMAFAGSAATVGILGLGYKPGAGAPVPSAGLLLLDELSGSVVAYDPMIQVRQSVMAVQACVDGADVVIVTMPCKEFKDVEFKEGQVVIDCWRMFDSKTLELAGVKHVAIGRFIG